MGRLTALVELFLADPKAVLSGDRTHDSCALCGRRLTDSVSLLRGYGPDCSKNVVYLFRIFGRIEPEEHGPSETPVTVRPETRDDLSS